MRNIDFIVSNTQDINDPGENLVVFNCCEIY